nr:S-layer homology domain-containing protein [Cohnella thailandensis]
MYSWVSASSNVAPDYSFGEGYEIGFHNKNLITALKSLYSRLETVPSGLSTQAASGAQASDGKIAGTKNKALEYKLASVANSVYTANDPTKDSIDNLPAGTYYVRYASKPGYQGPVTVRSETGTKPVAPAAVPYDAGKSVEVVVGANSGGSIGGSNPPANTNTDKDDDTATNPGTGGSVTVSADVPSKTDASTGDTLASLTSEAAAKLIESVKKSESDGKKAVLELKVETADATKTAQLNIPKAVLDEIAKGTNASLQIKYGSVGTIAFDSKAIEAISANAGTGDVTIIIAKSELTEEGKQVLGDRPVYDLTVFLGTEKISSFGGGQANVFLPYTLKAGEAPEAIVVYYVTDEGELETVRGHYNAETGTVDFRTAHFSQYIVGYNPVSFADVPGSAWYSKAVGYLAARDIATGTDKGGFDPEGQVTRGQFIVLLLKAFGIQPEAAGAANFADAGDAYYTGYLAAAKKLGIATGVGDNLFAPNKTITRQELFTLLHRALEQLGELPAEKTGASLSSYADSGDIAGFAQEAFQSFVESGVVAGDGAKLDPKGITSRAEAAQVLYRLLSK